MRTARFLLPLLFALAAAGCARQQQTYYIIDPQTGQPVPVVAQQPQPYGQQGQYAQQGYEQQPAYEPAATQPQYAPQPYPQQQYAQAPASTPSAASARGLFSRSPAYAQQSYQSYQQPGYAQPSYQQPDYAAAPAAPTRSASGRGFFTSGASSRPVYQQPAPQYSGGPYVAAPSAAYAAAPATYQTAYTLDSGDRLRIVVFGQEGITNSYIVGVDGNVNLPLVGSVQARGSTTQQLSQTIAARLKQGYVREPHVSVEVEAYRPFFILGEVTTPGQYPYVPNMSAETAIAIAGGFSPRASKRTVELTRNAPGQQFKGEVPLNYPLRPGDTIVVKERWF
ncbi:polysaccharide export protein [Microbacteriaceae bacterium K1510]|nr:polysaccharide export protein [Microbacteriaceae bacterium K1510]